MLSATQMDPKFLRNQVRGAEGEEGMVVHLGWQSTAA